MNKYEIVIGHGNIFVYRETVSFNGFLFFGMLQKLQHTTVYIHISVVLFIYFGMEKSINWKLKLYYSSFHNFSLFSLLTLSTLFAVMMLNWLSLDLMELTGTGLIDTKYQWTQNDQIKTKNIIGRSRLGICCNGTGSIIFVVILSSHNNWYICNIVWGTITLWWYCTNRYHLLTDC